MGNLMWIMTCLQNVNTELGMWQRRKTVGIYATHLANINVDVRQPLMYNGCPNGEQVHLFLCFF